MESGFHQNHVELCGIVAEAPRLSHENRGESFYHFPLRVERLSGQEDTLPVLVSRTLLQTAAVEEGTALTVAGQLRSFNNKSGQGSRLVISVFARSLREEAEARPYNRILLSGAICRPPTLRRTPLGRCICDLILAVNRRYGRADYLPCIAWGQVAQQVSVLPVGEPLYLEGRVQSRSYTKVLGDTAEKRTAFEVSVMHLLEEESMAQRSD